MTETETLHPSYILHKTDVTVVLPGLDYDIWMTCKQNILIERLGRRTCEGEPSP